MTKCKKRSMMLPEIESVRGEQLCGTPEAQRLVNKGSVNKVKVNKGK